MSVTIDVPTPIDELASEHEVIQQVVAGLAVLEERLRAGGLVDASLLRRILEFLREYADRLHHAKEEVVLFPALELRGVPPRGCPVGALLGEHKQGRLLVAEFSHQIEAYAGGGADAAATLIETIAALTKLYPAHIWKEDFLLFPMSEKVLQPDDLAGIAGQFSALNQELGAVALARFKNLAHELTELVLEG